MSPAERGARDKEFSSLKADWVGKVVRDPTKPADALTLSGYLGDSATPEHLRLYFEVELATWVDIPGAAILHAQRLPEETSPLDMIVEYRRTEREAARTLALANMAGFDVLNACFDAKFAYYYVRPHQASSLVRTSIPVPNHPSYPSGHSCITATYATVLGSVFPEETEGLEAMIEEAGRSRMYGGLHYLFDCIVGQNLGRAVAGQVLRTAPKGHEPIPLD